VSRMGAPHPIGELRRRDRHYRLGYTKAVGDYFRAGAGPLTPDATSWLTTPSARLFLQTGERRALIDVEDFASSNPDFHLRRCIPRLFRTKYGFEPSVAREGGGVGTLSPASAVGERWFAIISDKIGYAHPRHFDNSNCEGAALGS
jgi:hypothetical protein